MLTVAIYERNLRKNSQKIPKNVNTISINNKNKIIFHIRRIPYQIIFYMLNTSLKFGERNEQFWQGPWVNKMQYYLHSMCETLTEISSTQYLNLIPSFSQWRYKQTLNFSMKIKEFLPLRTDNQPLTNSVFCSR